MTATAVYSDGTHKDVTGQVTWASSNTAVATLTSSGSSAGMALGVTAAP